MKGRSPQSRSRFAEAKLVVRKTRLNIESHRTSRLSLFATQYPPNGSFHVVTNYCVFHPDPSNLNLRGDAPYKQIFDERYNIMNAIYYIESEERRCKISLYVWHKQRVCIHFHVGVDAKIKVYLIYIYWMKLKPPFCVLFSHTRSNITNHYYWIIHSVKWTVLFFYEPTAYQIQLWLQTILKHQPKEPALIISPCRRPFHLKPPLPHDFFQEIL